MDALSARRDIDRYRQLYADPALAIDVAWAWAGGVTAGALAALPLDHLGPGDLVLDVGSGDGLAGAYVAWRTGAQVIGLDLREEARGPAAELARRLGIRLRAAKGSLLVPPRDVDRLLSDVRLVVAFRVLHEIDPPAAEEAPLATVLGEDAGPSRADSALRDVSWEAPVAVLEREMPASEVLRRARNRAVAGLPVADARLIRSEGLDGRGWFPFTLHRRGAPGLDPAGLRRMWEPALHEPSPWHGWAAELVLERAGAVLHAPGLWVAGDRVFALDDGLLHEHGSQELPRLEAELRARSASPSSSAGARRSARR